MSKIFTDRVEFFDEPRRFDDMWFYCNVCKKDISTSASVHLKRRHGFVLLPRGAVQKQRVLR